VRIGVSAFLVTLQPGMRLAGVGRHMVSILEQICTHDAGHQFDIFVCDTVTLPPHWAESPWVRFHRVQIFSAKQRVPWAHFRVAREAKRLGCEKLFVLFNDVPIFSPIPVISVVHDAFPRSHGEWFPVRKRIILDQLTNLACKVSRKVITVSEFSASELSRHYSTDRSKFVVVPNGPGNELRKLSADELAQTQWLPDLGRYIFSISTLEPRKNLIGLIKGFERIRSQGFNDVRLVIAGASGWMQSDLKSRVESSPAKDFIHFLGYIDDFSLNAYLQNATSFALVSHVEGFGIPVLEAMILGVPVVTSSTSSLPEVAGENAFYCDPSNVESISSALIDSLTEDQKRKEFIAQNLARSKQFTWENAFKKIILEIES
jgi:glycosyltransferase involved in cell wall biosynthesis